MADIYSLAIRADTSDIRRGRQDLDRFGNQAGRTRSTVTELGKSLVIFTAAATATSVALGAMAVKSIKAAKEVVGLARVANSTVPEFQKMAFGAKTVGVEAGQLSGILKDMSDRVGDFLTTGGGEMADFFEKIAPQVGVTAEQFRELSGPDALQLFVSSLEKANVSQNEMIFFMEAMSSESTRLLPLLRNNGAAMAEQAKQAEALGIALSEVDAQKITDAAEQIDAVGSVFSALSEQLAAEVSPLVSALSRQFLDFTEDAGGVDEAVSDLSENVDILKASFAGLAGAAATLTAIAVATRAATVAQIAFNIAARANPYVFLATVLGTAAAAIYSLNDSMDPAIERADKLKEAVGGLTDNLDLLTRAELENRKASFAQDMIESRTEAEKLAAKLGTVQDIIKNSGQLTPQGGAMQIATSEDINRARELKAQIDELNLAADASSGAIEKVNALLESLGEKSETSSTELEKAAKAADNYASVISALNPAQAEFTRYADQLDMIDSFNISAGEKEALREESFRQHQERMNAIASEGNAGMTKQASINREASGTAASLMSEEASIIASYERRRDIILDSTNTTGTARNNLLVQLENEKNEKINDLNAGFWEQYLEAAEVTMSDLQELTAQVANNFTSSFGNAFESVIFDFESVEDAGKKMLETLLRSTVNALAQMAAQWLIYQAVQAASGSAAGAASATALSAEAAALQQVAAVGAYASTAAIPIVGPALAPAAAGLAIATTTPFVAAATGLAATMGTAMAGARAMGGSVTGGGSYMVGENGPEVVTMGGSGVVTPSSVNNNGGTTNVTQVFQLGGGGGDAKREILAAAPFIKAQAKQAVLEAINQGGAMSRAVGRRG